MRRLGPAWFPLGKDRGESAANAGSTETEVKGVIVVDYLVVNPFGFIIVRRIQDDTHIS